MKKLRTYYDTLQISRSASGAVVKAAYKALSQRFHPDKNPDSTETAHRNMQRLNEAYSVLSDEQRRREYDDALDEKERELHDSAIHERTRDSTADDRQTRRTQSESKGNDAKPAAPVHHTSDRERREGKSRFEPKNQGSAAAFTEYLSPAPPKQTNVLVAVLLGFAEGFRGHPIPASEGISRRKGGGIRFWNCLVIGLIAAWILAQSNARQLRTGHAGLPFQSLIVDPGFLGMVAAPFIALIGAASVGYMFASIFKTTRPYSSTVGLFFLGALFAALIVGEEVGQTHQAMPPSSPPQSKLPQYNSGPTTPELQAQPRRDTEYDQTVRDLEQRYPQLNPDSAAFREDLSLAVIERFRSHARTGISASDAIKRAVAEYDAAGVLRRKQPVAPPAPITNGRVNSQPANPHHQQSLQRDRPCEFKGVMTDDDYTACGIKPPR